MKFKSLGYCIVQGLKSIGRNRIFSLASIATMSLCIFILGIFYSVTANVSYMVSKMSDSLCVKVFFDEGTSDERIESIGNSIKEYEGVVTVHFTSAEEAWAEYKDKYFGEEYEELAEGYENDNPLKNSASYEVYFDSADIQQDLVSYISRIDGVRRVNSSEVTAESLSEINSLVALVSIVILAVLFGIALFLINNTISIGIAVRNEEISIMRLLGARNAFIRAPFVVQGIIMGIIGAAIPLLLVYFAYGNLVNFVLRKFSFLSTVLTFMPISQLYRTFIPVALILGVGLGLAGSLISLGKHLKK
ncbi:MAG: permease-like cell division protein FtsX [Butyrivibrio sp.]